MNVSRLRRVRWAVRAVLLLGVAASVWMNILHARPDPIAQVIAAWPPCALLLAIELIARVPVHRRWLAAIRLLAAAVIAAIAAWVSYWHMAAVVSAFGEVGAAPFLLPLSVDGLVVIAAVSLVELAGRIAVIKPDKDFITYNDQAVSLEVEPPPASSVIAPDVPSATGPAATSPVAEPVAEPRRSRRPLVAEYRAKNPAARQADAVKALAALGVTERAVRLHWPDTAPVAATVNGRRPGSG